MLLTPPWRHLYLCRRQYERKKAYSEIRTLKNIKRGPNHKIIVIFHLTCYQSRKGMNTCVFWSEIIVAKWTLWNRTAEAFPSLVCCLISSQAPRLIFNFLSPFFSSFLHLDQNPQKTAHIEWLLINEELSETFWILWNSRFWKRSKSMTTVHMWNYSRCNRSCAPAHRRCQGADRQRLL